MAVGMIGGSSAKILFKEKQTVNVKIGAVVPAGVRDGWHASAEKWRAAPQMVSGQSFEK